MKLPASVNCGRCGIEMERGSEACKVEGVGLCCKQCHDQPEDKTDYRKIDLLVARDLLNMPGVGYYRRKSCHSSESELCNKGDVTPDHPQWKARLYYKHPATNLYAVPSFSTEIRDAWQIVGALSLLYDFEMHRPDGGTWMVMFVSRDWRRERFIGVHHKEEMAICIAALKTIGVVIP